MSAITAGPRAWASSYVSTFPKGKVLSHLLGIIIASQFIVAGAALGSVPYVKLPMNTGWLDLPLRLIAVWLLLDRNWRIGRLKFTHWEVLALGFPVVVGLAYPFSAADIATGADGVGYRSFVGDMLRFYTVFILVREGHLRAGFDTRVLLRWLMAGLAFSALLGLLQAFNVGGVRSWSQGFYSQDKVSNTASTFRARGTAMHWNSFASHMVIAALFAVAALNWRRLKWWEYGLAALFVAGLAVSTSRGGYITLGVTVFAAAVFFLMTNRPRNGWLIAGGLVASSLAFLAVVVAFDIKHFRNLISPPVVKSREAGSLAYRLEMAQKLTQVGLQRPLTGTGPSDRIYMNRRTTYYSSASVPGIHDVTYPLLFAQFGLVGILYMVGMVWFFVRFLSRKHARHPYALLAFCTGVMLAVYSTSEMLLRTDLMYLVSVVAALAVTRFNPVPLRQAPPTPERARL
jgi:hypothetical protein